MPSAFKLTSHFVQQHIGQQRGKRKALRHALHAFDHHTAIHDARVQPGPNQPDHSSIVHALAQSVNQDIVIHAVEELRQIHVHHGAVALLRVPLRCQHGIPRTAAGAEPVAVLTEGQIDQRLQHLQ